MMGLIAPHLERAIRIIWLFKDIELRLGAAYDALERLLYGIFLLGKNGTVLFINDLGRRTIARADGLSLVHGRLTATLRSDNCRLQLLS
ncbi:MAG: hypothetical protein KGO02_00245 [Alphaproteobacteria bacterium]|nr:hypothetical protein [Alphaproteobacteria bacterium]